MNPPALAAGTMLGAITVQTIDGKVNLLISQNGADAGTYTQILTVQ
jgi:hypothetical protein